MRNRDIERQPTLEALGWQIIRVNADMLRYRQEVIIDANARRAARSRRGRLIQRELVTETPDANFERQGTFDARVVRQRRTTAVFVKRSW